MKRNGQTLTFFAGMLLLLFAAEGKNAVAATPYGQSKPATQTATPVRSKKKTTTLKKTPLRVTAPIRATPMRTKPIRTAPIRTRPIQPATARRMVTTRKALAPRAQKVPGLQAPATETRAPIRPTTAKTGTLLPALRPHITPVTATLAANPRSILAGTSSILTWNTQGADDVTLDGQKVNVSGSQAVTPTQTTTYHLSAKGLGGTLEATAQVTVSQPKPTPTPVTATLIASPNTIQAGTSTTLTWNTQGADDVTLDGQKVNASGSQAVTPTQTTTYHLLAKGAGGTQEATAQVTVSQPTSTPTPTPAANTERR